MNTICSVPWVRLSMVICNEWTSCKHSCTVLTMKWSENGMEKKLCRIYQHESQQGLEVCEVIVFEDACCLDMLTLCLL